MNEFKVGERVHYTPVRGKRKTENGIVKSLCDDPGYVFVVYSCGGNWSQYQDYTAARTSVNDLSPGWIDRINEEAEPN